MYLQFFCYLFSFELAFGGFIDEVHGFRHDIRREVTLGDADVKQVLAVIS